MTFQARFQLFITLLLFAGIAILSFLLNFNGLYGQDAHEYLRQSRAVFEYWNSASVMPVTPGDVEFAIGYPAAGALLRFLFGDSILALQLVSWLSFAVSVWLLERILALLTHGSRADSRWSFVTLGLAMAPVFVRSGLTLMSDALGMAMVLAAFLFALRWMELRRGSDACWSAVFMALALSVRLGLAGMLIPLALLVAWYLVERRAWRWMVLALLAGIVVLLPQLFLETSVIVHPFQHSPIHWSPAHFFQRSFHFENGLSQYLLPNILYLAFPLMHPGFCLLLPGLLLLAKKTDLALSAKKVILICLAGYLLLLGGLPHQNLRFLLPAYALLLLLLFPAWDRMYCYGFYFFKRLTWSILGITFLLQILATGWMLYPTLSRNHLEQSVAHEIRASLPAGATVFGFDLDIAMKSYLPDIQFFNLWERRYIDFPAGSFVLFNEPALRPQWEGQNPMLNWDFLRDNYTLEPVKNLPDGWVLYQIGQRY
jgi:4-amino-4-deoxy-L-arabinose transferase-like glycosyltransferase